MKDRIYEKFRPRITRLQHYPPRALDVPESYRDVLPPSEPPTLAIVTPSYNQASFIGATVDSVLGQGYPALNFHVQDAKSSDDTISVLKSRNDPFYAWLEIHDNWIKVALLSWAAFFALGFAIAILGGASSCGAAPSGLF